MPRLPSVARHGGRVFAKRSSSIKSRFGRSETCVRSISRLLSSMTTRASGHTRLGAAAPSPDPSRRRESSPRAASGRRRRGVLTTSAAASASQISLTQPRRGSRRRVASTRAPRRSTARPAVGGRSSRRCRRGARGFGTADAVTVHRRGGSEPEAVSVERLGGESAACAHSVVTAGGPCVRVRHAASSSSTLGCGHGQRRRGGRCLCRARRKHTWHAPANMCAGVVARARPLLEVLPAQQVDERARRRARPDRDPNFRCARPPSATPQADRETRVHAARRRWRATD